MGRWEIKFQAAGFTEFVNTTDTVCKMFDVFTKRFLGRHNVKTDVIMDQTRAHTTSPWHYTVDKQNGITLDSSIFEYIKILSLMQRDQQYICIAYINILFLRFSSSWAML